MTTTYEHKNDWISITCESGALLTLLNYLPNSNFRRSLHCRWQECQNMNIEHLVWNVTLPATAVRNENRECSRMVNSKYRSRIFQRKIFVRQMFPNGYAIAWNLGIDQFIFCFWSLHFVLCKYQNYWISNATKNTRFVPRWDTKLFIQESAFFTWTK